MSDIFEIKEEYKSTIVGFNNSGLPLGQRNDLHLLAQMAEHNPSFRKYFVQYPIPAIVEEHKVEAFLAKTEPVAELGNTTKRRRGKAEESINPESTPVINEPEETINE